MVSKNDYYDFLSGLTQEQHKFFIEYQDDIIKSLTDFKNLIAEKNFTLSRVLIKSEQHDKIWDSILPLTKK